MAFVSIPLLLAVGRKKKARFFFVVEFFFLRSKKKGGGGKEKKKKQTVEKKKTTPGGAEQPPPSPSPPKRPFPTSVKRTRSLVPTPTTRQRGPSTLPRYDGRTGLGPSAASRSRARGRSKHKKEKRGQEKKEKKVQPGNFCTFSQRKLFFLPPSFRHPPTFFQHLLNSQSWPSPRSPPPRRSPR